MVITRIIDYGPNGNAILDATLNDLQSIGINFGDAINVSIAGEEIFKGIPLYSGFYCRMGEVVLLCKDNRIQLATRGGSLKKSYFFPIDARVVLELCEASKYWEQENAYSFEEIYDRKLFHQVEDFANFRPILADNRMFYRSSSPFDNTYGRAQEAAECVKKYRIATIIDMADTAEELMVLNGNMPDDLLAIFSSRKIITLGDDSGIFSKKFKDSALAAINAAADNVGPLLIHCKAGKRRSGFVCAILQGLAGMSQEEIVADYMTSYKNNNGVTLADNPQRYWYLANDTIVRILHTINGNDLSNLHETTKDFLLSGGMSSERLALLTKKLHII